MTGDVSLSVLITGLDYFRLRLIWPQRAATRANRDFALVLSLESGPRTERFFFVRSRGHRAFKAQETRIDTNGGLFPRRATS